MVSSQHLRGTDKGSICSLMIFFYFTCLNGLLYLNIKFFVYMFNVGLKFVLCKTHGSTKSIHDIYSNRPFFLGEKDVEMWLYAMQWIVRPPNRTVFFT